MCMLCGETRYQGIQETTLLAYDLRRLAVFEEGLAKGKIDPHGADMRGISGLAQSIVRRLVAEYV